MRNLWSGSGQTREAGTGWKLGAGGCCGCCKGKGQGEREKTPSLLPLLVAPVKGPCLSLPLAGCRAPERCPSHPFQATSGPSGCAPNGQGLASTEPRTEGQRQPPHGSTGRTLTYHAGCKGGAFSLQREEAGAFGKNHEQKQRHLLGAQISAQPLTHHATSPNCARLPRAQDGPSHRSLDSTDRAHYLGTCHVPGGVLNACAGTSSFGVEGVLCRVPGKCSGDVRGLPESFTNCGGRR